MLISDELFDAYLKCKTKAQLTFGLAGTDEPSHAISDWQRRLAENYEADCRDRLQAAKKENYLVGSPRPEDLIGSISPSQLMVSRPRMCECSRCFDSALSGFGGRIKGRTNSEACANACLRQLAFASSGGRSRVLSLGMIPRCTAASLLTLAMSAQDARAPRVRIIFPEGVQSNRESMTYGRYSPTVRHTYAGVSGLTIGSPFGIPMDKGDWFRVWFGHRGAR